jgi:hypothetical protein
MRNSDLIRPPRFFFVSRLVDSEQGIVVVCDPHGTRIGKWVSVGRRRRHDGECGNKFFVLLTFIRDAGMLAVALSRTVRVPPTLSTVSANGSTVPLAGLAATISVCWEMQSTLSKSERPASALGRGGEGDGR